MAVVTEIFDDSFVDVDVTGGSAARCFMVTDLTAGTPNDVQTAAFLACNLPYNSPHPTIAGLYVKGFRAIPVGQSNPTNNKTAVRVLVKYQSNDSALAIGATKIEICGSNGITILNRWPVGHPLAGKPILVGYAPAGANFPSAIDVSGITADPNQNNGFYYDTVQVPVQSPNTIIRFTRRETGSPLQKSTNYRRKMNINAIWGYAPNTLLCRRIDGVNLIGVGNIIAPNLYDVVYEFEHNPEFGGWARVEFFRDIHSDKPPPTVNILAGDYNGYTIVLPYGTADFTALALPSPT